MKLTVVIPALNEEEAIGSIITRSLAAREHITAASPVTEVEIIVVNDGSTDRTPAIAAEYDDIRLINFPKNRGYGAAIKAGFEAGTGELVGFLDADGTCDPRFFADLCAALHARRASVAIGSRLGPQSRMPRLRRLGNRIYALILSTLSNRVVTDTASGMRVIRRTALEKLYPLPDGLNFTPAMSARVLMDDELSIIEVPMPYEERIGESKLHVLRDGWRFLRTICQMSMMWKPSRFFITTAVVMLNVMILLAMHPIELWWTTAGLREDMIYRLLFCAWIGAIAAMLTTAGVIADRLHRLLAGRPEPRTFLAAALDRWYTLKGTAITAGLITPLLLALVGGGIWTRFTAGYVDLHWSRIVLAGLLSFGVLQLGVGAILANIISYHAARRGAAVEAGTQTFADALAELTTIEIPAPRSEHARRQAPSVS